MTTPTSPPADVGGAGLRCCDDDACPGCFRVGDVVDYHSIIGGPVTKANVTIRDLGELGHRQRVAWLTGKSGCVSLCALTLVSKSPPPPSDRGER